jgi:hypothetical protein
LNGIAGAEIAVGYDQAVRTTGNIIKDAAECARDLMVDGIPGANHKDGMTGGRSVYVSDIDDCRVRADCRMQDKRGIKFYGKCSCIAALIVSADHFEGADAKRLGIEGLNGDIVCPGASVDSGGHLGTAAAGAVALLTADSNG